MTEHVKSPADGGAFYWGAVKTVDTVGKNATDGNGGWTQEDTVGWVRHRDFAEPRLE